MKINEQTQDLSDLMQNFFKKKNFKILQNQNKKMQYPYVNICTLGGGGNGILSCIS